MKASDVMTRDVLTVTRGAPLPRAIRLMLDHNISGLPVVDADGKVEGILTEGDLLRRSEIATEKHHWPWLDFLLGPGRMASDYVKTHGRVCDELMSGRSSRSLPHAPLAEIVALMERRRIKRVPVIEDGALLGMVSRADLLAALAPALDAPQIPGRQRRRHPRAGLGRIGKGDWAPRAGLTITVTDGIVDLDGVILDEHERAALRVAAENVPGVKAVSDRLVWVEPVSGTVIERADENSATIKPAAR